MNTPPSPFERLPFVEELEHKRAEVARDARAQRLGCLVVLLLLGAVALAVWR